MVSVQGDQDYGYKYPKGLDLRPGHDRHDQIVSRIMDCARYAARAVGDRRQKWDKIDAMMKSYIPHSEAEALVKASDSRKPISVVIPMSYAMNQTLLTYLVGVFMQPPVFAYEATGPEDVLGVTMLEHLIDQQFRRARMAVALAVQFKDAITYGIGIAASRWDSIQGDIERLMPSSTWTPYGMIPGAPKRRTVRETIYEGNALGNIDPYSWLPDPNVPAHRVQDGTFVGWSERTSRLLLEEDEARDGSEMFNVKYLRSGSRTSTLWRGTSAEKGGRSIPGRGSDDLAEPVDLVHMYARLIPKEWKLGTGDSPEMWRFTVAADSILIEAHKLGLNHGQFPVAVAAPDFDGYDALPMSRTETTYGLQEVTNWLFNSHMQAVRQTVKPKDVIDPSGIHVASLYSDDSPAIFLKEEAYGTGVDKWIYRLPTNDVTRGNIADSMYVADMIERATGVSDPIQGVIKNKAERRTATEVRGVIDQAVSRMGTMAKMIATTSMYDLAWQFAHNTQQFLTDETYARVTGKLEDTLRAEYGQSWSWAKVRPQDLSVGFDVIPKDVTDSGKLDLDSWMQIFQTGIRTPALAARYDWGRIFDMIARKSGVGSLAPFEVKVLPDAQVGQMASQGQLAPMADQMQQMGQMG
jgi:hypothetical protein